ncbi:hypothetical protein Q31b_46740 [Novipirellula aureliae]|uniref:Uncharacterized protein n=1 Tax=Novipirellula aureliae TaxID=2527966 RepID=A0A5C6DNV1_9BACT|nr:hypothetical protein [Novipirellula aureliae]TWU37885.1 hypothetical protein Q31b_46740 [Novipirellula aureliae]
MNEQTPFKGSRRDWFVSVYRNALLVILSIGSAFLAFRSRDASGCTRRIPCQTCGLWDRCEQPAALSSRRAKLQQNVKKGLR